MVSEFIKDKVPVKPDIDKNLPQEEKLRIRFGVAKLIKTWYEIREAEDFYIAFSIFPPTVSEFYDKMREAYDELKSIKVTV